MGKLTINPSPSVINNILYKSNLSKARAVLPKDCLRLQASAIWMQSRPLGSLTYFLVSRWLTLSFTSAALLHAGRGGDRNGSDNALVSLMGLDLTS